MLVLCCKGALSCGTFVLMLLPPLLTDLTFHDDAPTPSSEQENGMMPVATLAVGSFAKSAPTRITEMMMGKIRRSFDAVENPSKG